jgi:hypothetical protein
MIATARRNEMSLTSSPPPPAFNRTCGRLWIPLVVLLGIAGSATAQDDFKLIKVEQDVRILERQVGELNRQVDELRRELGQPGTSSAPPTRSAGQSPSTQWVNAAAWERVRPGMDELQVIDALGPPTSMRVDGDARILLYALEIGSSGFLSGSVTLKNKKVTLVERPALK